MGFFNNLKCENVIIEVDNSIIFSKMLKTTLLTYKQQKYTFFSFRVHTYHIRLRIIGHFSTFVKFVKQLMQITHTYIKILGLKRNKNYGCKRSLLSTQTNTSQYDMSKLLCRNYDSNRGKIWSFGLYCGRLSLYFLLSLFLDTILS